MNYFEELDALRIAYPDLTYQNDGYDNIPDEVREANREGNDAIEAILKKTVSGFVRFQNFTERKDGSIDLRYQCYWSEWFIGVEYTPLENFKPDSPTWKHNREQADEA